MLFILTLLYIFISISVFTEGVETDHCSEQWSRSQTAWIHIYVSKSIGCVTLSKFPNLSGLQCPHLWDRATWAALKSSAWIGCRDYVAFSMKHTLHIAQSATVPPHSTFSTVSLSQIIDRFQLKKHWLEKSHSSQRHWKQCLTLLGNCWQLARSPESSLAITDHRVCRHVHGCATPTYRHAHASTCCLSRASAGVALRFLVLSFPSQGKLIPVLSFETTSSSMPVKGPSER